MKTVLAKDTIMKMIEIQFSSDFMECSKREIWKLMKPQINCSIVGLEQFFDCSNEMSQCQSKDDAFNTFYIYLSLVYESYSTFWSETCAVPCIQVDQRFSTWGMPTTRGTWEGPRGYAKLKKKH
jgi:hypothetical protein